jgi:thiosulfate/3-mercaptopyruvate sulfurtransferase
MTFTTLIPAAEVAASSSDSDCLIIDVRHDLQNPSAGHDAYATGHIPGARFLHLDNDLSGPKTAHSGRHPLPDRQAFVERMLALGLDQSSQVVAYDAHGGMFAARLWWMLRWIGHEAVAVLDGGWQAWLEAGGASEQARPAPPAAGDFSLGPSLTRQVDVADVMQNLSGGSRLIVDARAADRFRGENETLDPVGGHIPGARNRFFRDNLGADGRFKPADTLRAEFEAVLGNYEAAAAVMQCGSGVTACHNLLALEIAGLSGAALYPGSWSQWCSDPGRPVSRGNED